MILKKKKQYKLWAKLFGIFAYVMLILFIVLLIYATILIKPDVSMQQAFLIFSPLLATTVFIFISSYLTEKRKKYKQAIYLYRQYKFFNVVLDLVEQNKISEAVDIYNGIIRESTLRDFLYAYIISAEIHSNKPDHIKNGLDELNKVTERWNQFNINYNFK